MGREFVVLPPDIHSVRTEPRKVGNSRNTAQLFDHVFRGGQFHDHDNTELFSDCKPRNVFARPDINSAFYPAMDWRRLTISERLAVLRKVHGLTQAQMAVEIGTDPRTDTYGSAERSGQIAQLAPRIYARFPEIDAGWLFQGLTGNVSQTTERRLSEAARDLGLTGTTTRDKG